MERQVYLSCKAEGPEPVTWSQLVRKVKAADLRRQVAAIFTLLAVPAPSEGRHSGSAARPHPPLAAGDHHSISPKLSTL